jgi:hypothetical protein
MSKVKPKTVLTFERGSLWVFAGTQKNYGLVETLFYRTWKITLTITLIKSSIMLIFINLFDDREGGLASLCLLPFAGFASVFPIHADLREKDRNKVRLLWKRNRILFTNGAR